MPRWDSSATEHEGKLYIFGGHSSDSSSTNSMLCLNLSTLHFTQIKAANPPSPRGGCSLNTWKNKLILFGGSEEAKQDTPRLNEVWFFDIDSHTWSQRVTQGEAPAGRDGHASSVINNSLLIYGGSSESSIYGEAHTLCLKTFEWRTVPQLGDCPGVRESMGCTTLGKKLYIFGGNTNPPWSSEDAYSNELFELSLVNGIVRCKKLSQEGPSPRLSMSLVPLHSRLLVVFGGDSHGVVQKDLWIFDLLKNTWSELSTLNSISPRMTQVSCVYKSQFLMFGGFDAAKAALSEIAKIDLSDVYAEPRGSKKNWFCSNCSHSSEVCEFRMNFPETHPLLFYARSQIPIAIVDYLAKPFFDAFAAVLKISQLGQRLSLNYHGAGLYRDGQFVKSVFELPSLNVSCPSGAEPDLHEKTRKAYFSNWGTVKEEEVNVISVVFLDVMLKPGDVAKLCSGHTDQFLLGALFKLSNSVLVVSKTSEFVTICLLRRQSPFVPMFLVVLNEELEPVFPDESAFFPNWQNILEGSHFSIQLVCSLKTGLHIYLYTKDISGTDDDLFVQDIPLALFLSYSYYKPSFESHFLVNYKPVSFFNVQDSHKTFLKDCSEVKYYRSEEIEQFKLLIYYLNKLVYWEARQGTGRKQSRDLTVIARTKARFILNTKTGLLDWNSNTFQLLSFIQDSEIK